jgi:hypothetical protein
MQAVSTSPFNLSMLRKRNVWYTVKDGNWSDPAIWMSNGKRKHSVPQQGDDVCVEHNVNYDNDLDSEYLFNHTIGNLFIARNGVLTATTNRYKNLLIINGNLQCDGAVDFSTTISDITLALGGIDNYINRFYSGSQSTVKYLSSLNQPVLPVNYFNIEISNTNIKYVHADFFVNGVLTIDIGSTLELGSYNSIIAISNISGTLTKGSSAGTVSLTTLSIQNGSGSINFLDNPTVNISGDFSGDIRNGVNFGSGTLNVLTTQIWTLTGSGNLPQSTGSNNVVIATGKTLTIAANSGLNIGGWVNNGSITGADATATLNIEGTYAFGNNNEAMPIGIFNYNHSGTSNIQVQPGVIITLAYPSYYDLTVNGIVALGGNTTVSNNTLVKGSLQMGDNDFTCNGATAFSGSLLASGSGTLGFNKLSILDGTGSISFTGSPTTNLSGDFIGDARAGIYFGSVPVNITANMNIGLWSAGNNAAITYMGMFIASGVTLINIGQNSAYLGGINLTGTINGVDTTAVFDNRSVCNYQNIVAPMATGRLFCNQAMNTFIYGALADQDITTPSDIVPGYQNLTLSGSGIKRLLADVSVKAIYTLASPAILNSNGYTLTNP